MSRGEDDQSVKMGPRRAAGVMRVVEKCCGDKSGPYGY